MNSSGPSSSQEVQDAYKPSRLAAHSTQEAGHFYALVMTMFDVEREPTASDLSKMAALDAEFRAFHALLKTGKA
jgi:hypothetical protein